MTADATAKTRTRKVVQGSVGLVLAAAVLALLALLYVAPWKGKTAAIRDFRGALSDQSLLDGQIIYSASSNTWNASDSTVVESLPPCGKTPAACWASDDVLKGCRLVSPTCQPTWASIGPVVANRLLSVPEGGYPTRLTQDLGRLRLSPSTECVYWIYQGSALDPIGSHTVCINTMERLLLYRASWL